MNRTKIVCTIGPAVDRLESMLDLLDAGMSVARLNFSHGTHEYHLRSINNLKKAREMTGRPLAIMLDTKGPEIRVGKIHGDSIQLAPKDRLRLVAKAVQLRDIPIHPFEALESIGEGAQILFDDGYINTRLVGKEKDALIVEIANGGVLKSGKGINIPGAHLPLPAMTPQDIEDIRFGALHDVDYIAASFIRSAHHVLAIKELLAKEGKPDILVIAKIENAQGVENFDSIIQASDGIMVARGDLGVEVELSQVPRLQKMMIRKCHLASKPVVTATQMLESMISNSRPTRAEVSDVANAIYDGSSAIMLSGETAVGKYPIETVRRMKEIAIETEADFNYRAFFDEYSRRGYHDISSSVALAAVKTAYSAGAKTIFAYTSSGATARLVSRLRPEMPIVALTTKLKTYHQLAFNWGVVPLLAENCQNSKEAFSLASAHALSKGLLTLGDVVVATSGVPFGKKGSTNMMMVEQIGEILIRGHKGTGPQVTGQITLLVSAESIDPETLKGKLVVISQCDSTFLEALKLASGVILQNALEDTASEKYALLVAKTFHISVITRADGAMALLQEGDLVTLDPHRGIVYAN